MKLLARIKPTLNTDSRNESKEKNEVNDEKNPSRPESEQTMKMLIILIEIFRNFRHSPLIFSQILVKFYYGVSAALSQHTISVHSILYLQL